VTGSCFASKHQCIKCRARFKQLGSGPSVGWSINRGKVSILCTNISIALAAGDVAVAHKWWEDALEKASANAYDQFMADAGLEVRQGEITEAPAEPCHQH